MTLAHDLLAIEKNFWTGGPEAYRQFADDECLLAFGEMAGIQSNDEIAKTAEKGRWGEVTMKQKGVRQLGDDSAVITYEATTTRKDGKPYHALVSSAYVKRPTGWKLAFHQQTPLQ